MAKYHSLRAWRLAHQLARRVSRVAGTAASSLAEVEYLLLFAYEEGYLSKEEYSYLNHLQRHTTTLVYRLARSLERAAG